MKELLDEKRKNEIEILAVSPESHEDSKALIAKLNGDPASFPIRLLEDKEHKVIDRYGLLNTGSPRGIPHPTTLVINKKGVVVWRFTEVDYKVRPTNEMILQALEKNGM